MTNLGLFISKRREIQPFNWID